MGKTINLTQPSDDYKVITFPDGEKHLELAPLNRKESVNVICRITNSDDLFILMQLADILKRQCVEVETLYISYLMGMRCDRLFDVNRPFTLGIVADVINSLGALSVFIHEPHSTRALRLINNAFSMDVTYPLMMTIAKEYNETQAKEHGDMLFVAPDFGAQKRYGAKFAVVCSKVRDEATGKLLNFNVEENLPVKGRDLLVVDDLCDGGGTFVGLAPKIRDLKPKSLSLLVAHAVQKEGIERVAAVYDKVYITNTYKDWRAEKLPVNVVVY